MAESIDLEKRLEDLIKKLDRTGVHGPERVQRMLDWYFAKYGPKPAQPPAAGGERTEGDDGQPSR